MTTTKLPLPPRLELHDIAIEQLESRCRELEDEVSTLKNAFELLKPCDECGVVYASPEDWAEHICHGRQGR